MYRLRWLRELSTQFHSEREVENEIMVTIAAHLGYGPKDRAVGYRIPNTRDEADVVLFSGAGDDPDCSLVVFEVKKPGNPADPKPQARRYARQLRSPLYGTLSPDGTGLVIAIYGRTDDTLVFKCSIANLEYRWDELSGYLHRTLLIERYAGQRRVPSVDEMDSASWEQAYRKRILERYGSVALFGRRLLDMSKVFVSVRLAAYQDLDVTELKSDPFRHVETVRRSDEGMFLEDWLYSRPRLVIIGDPGAGKTTLSRHLTLQLAAGNISGMEQMIPVFISLNAFYKERRSVDDPDVTEYFFEYFRREAEGLGVPVRGDLWLRHLLAKGRAVIIWDGLDEVSGYSPEHTPYSSAEEEAVLLIRRLSDRFRTAPMLVTCRRGAWHQRAGNLAADFAVLEPLSFREKERSAFLRNWFVEKPELGEQAISTIDRSNELRALSTNPLLLSFMAFRYEGFQSMPLDRYDLFEGCVSLLIKDWDEDPDRKIKRNPVIPPHGLRRLLCRIALHFHQKGLRYFARRDLYPLVATFLTELSKGQSDVSDVIREDLESKYGLIREGAPDLLSFIHLALQEFFAAEAIDKDWANWWPDRIWAMVGDSWWEQVILHLAADGRAEPIIERLLHTPDDLFSTHTLLAGKCLLAASSSVPIAPGLRQAVQERLMGVLTHGHTVASLEATRTLGGIDNPANVEPLASIIRSKPSRAAAALRVLTFMRHPLALKLATNSYPAGSIDMLNASVLAISSMAGSTEVDNLISASRTPNDDNRDFHLFTLESIESPEASGALLAAANDQSIPGNIRMACLSSLAKAGVKESFPIILEHWGMKQFEGGYHWQSLLVSMMETNPLMFRRLLSRTDLTTLPSYYLRVLRGILGTRPISLNLADRIEDALHSDDDQLGGRRFGLLALLARFDSERAKRHVPPIPTIVQNRSRAWQHLILDYWPEEFLNHLSLQRADNVWVMTYGYMTKGRPGRTERGHVILRELWKRKGSLSRGTQNAILDALVRESPETFLDEWLATHLGRSIHSRLRLFSSLRDSRSRQLLLDILTQALRGRLARNSVSYAFTASSQRVHHDASFAEPVLEIMAQIPYPTKRADQEHWLELLDPLSSVLHVRIFLHEGHITASPRTAPIDPI